MAMPVVVVLAGLSRSRVQSYRQLDATGQPGFALKIMLQSVHPSPSHAG